VSATLTLQASAERFLARYANPHTARAYRQTLEPFYRAYGPQRALAGVTPEDLDDWNAALNRQPLTATTRATRRKALKVFFNWCVRREYLTANPARFLVVGQPQREAASKAIPTWVLDALFEATADKRDRFIRARDLAILALLKRYGARAGDVAHLTVGRVCFSEGWLILRVKGGHDHRLPLTQDVTAALLAWLEVRRELAPDPPHEFVFVNNRVTAPGRYGPLAAGSISTIVKRLAETVCGVQYGPHSIRHWRGQSLMDEGVPATVVQQILGHSDVRITLQHYANQDWQRVGRVLAHDVNADHTRPPDSTDPAFWRRGADRLKRTNT